MKLSSSGGDSSYGLTLCRQIVNEVSKAPTMDTFRKLIQTHNSELLEIITSGDEINIDKCRRMHSSAIDQICLATVENFPHVQSIGSVYVTFEVRGRIFNKIVNFDYQLSETVESNSAYLHTKIMESFGLPAEGIMSEWVAGSALRSLERSVDKKSHSGHADIKFINGDLYLLTIRMMPVDPDKGYDNHADETQEKSLRSDASLVQAGFLSDVVKDDYGKKLFHGLLATPECGFEVHNPESLQVSMVTEDYVLTIRSGTPEMIWGQEWDLLTRSFSGDLGVFPAYDADGRTRNMSRFRQLSGAIQGSVRTGKKVIAAHPARNDAVFIVDPIPSARELDAYSSSISTPLTDGWL